LLVSRVIIEFVGVLHALKPVYQRNLEGAVRGPAF
jgi:hypothetical protein